jgi:aminopeptidase YwaD
VTANEIEPIVLRLATEVGERFGGTEGEAQAARLIADEFAGLGLEVDQQRYSFISWQPDGAPRLRVVKPSVHELDVAPMLYTASTPVGGLRGHIAPYGRAILIPDVFELDTFALIGDDGSDLARIYVRGGGRAIPLQNARPMYRQPQVVIGEQDAAALRALAADGNDTIAELSVGGKLIPDAVSCNVIGKLRIDSSPERLVVCAHYDTTIGTPGAYDNASGVGGVCALARRLLAAPVPMNVDFIAFGCEEGGFWGSTYYVNGLADRGRIGDIKAVVNFDQISAGDFLWIWAGPDEFATRVRNALDAEGVTTRYDVRIDPPKPGADDFPFSRHGVPTVSFIFWVPPYYHTAEDTIDRLDSAKIHACTSTAERLVRELARTGS